MKSEENKEVKKNTPATQLNDEKLEQVSGGYMSFGKICKMCGGVINNDPNLPYDIRCHCNEDFKP